MVAGDGSGALSWTTVSKEEMYRGSVFTVFEQTSRGPEGREGRFSVLEARDWAVVVPLVRAEGEAQFLMVRQYRHGSDTASLEFPGGVVETGEAPEKAAARELAEETGWVSSAMYHAGTVFPQSGDTIKPFPRIPRPRLPIPLSSGTSMSMRSSMPFSSQQKSYATGWARANSATR